MHIPFALGWFSPPRRSSPLVGLALALAACPPPEDGAEGPEGPPGAQGQVGDTGPQGGDGIVALTAATEIDRGDGACPYGGIRYDSGPDDGSDGGVAGDGVLQPGEVDHSETICYPAESFVGFEAPEGPAGTARIDVSGGDAGVTGTGGYGGEIYAAAERTSGHVVAWPSGSADALFATPTPPTPFLGTEPLVIPASQNVTPKIIAPGGEGSLVEGDLFTYHNSSGTDDWLYRRRSGTNVRVTGVRIEAGGTLTVPRDTTYGRSYLGFPNDIVNHGTITTPLLGASRTALALAAHHYHGEPGSQVNLTGLAGTSSAAGGEGGDLVMLTGQGAGDNLWIYSTGGWYAYYGCNNNGTGLGGLYNRGVIDVSPGAIGTIEGGSSRYGRYLTLCSTDELYNEGLLRARGAGQSGNGGYLRASARGALFSGGSFDLRGGAESRYTANAGQIQLEGQYVVHNATVQAWAEDVPATTDCTTGCSAGEGGYLGVYAYGGSIAFGGSVDLRGGDAVGLGGPTGQGGGGGRVQLLSYPGVDSHLGADRQPGPIVVSADMDLRGGDGNSSGGYGGEAFARVSYYGAEGQPQGQGVSLLGYEGFDADGGRGGQGGRGGVLQFQSGQSSEYGGEYYVGVWGGAAVNEVPFVGRGGEGIDGGTGGSGGNFGLDARMYAPLASAVALSRAPVDVSGGAGAVGGRGGFAVADGAGFSEVSATIVANGGAGGPGGAGAAVGYGGEGGGGAVRSQYGWASLLADIQARGGAAFYGGEGGRAYLYGPTVDGVGAMIADGGAGSTSTGGTGGVGGLVDVWSSDTFSVVTGSLSASGATGATPGDPGLVLVDGFVWLAP